MSTIFALTPEEKDQLGELVNIGVSHAATTLSLLLKRRVAISVPEITIKNASDVKDFVERSDDITIAVLLRVSGALDGYVFVSFPYAASVHLLSAMTGKTVGDLRALDAFDRSLFQEVGNVVTGGMLFGLSKFLHLRLEHSVPEVVVDMRGAMFNSLAASMIALHEEFLALDVSICVDVFSDSVSCNDDKATVCRLFFFAGPEAVARILEVTHAMLGQGGRRGDDEKATAGTA